MSSSVALSRTQGLFLLLHMVALSGKSLGLWSFVSMSEISRVPAIDIPLISTKRKEKQEGSQSPQCSVLKNGSRL